MKNLRKLSNLELVRLLGEHCGHERLFREFVRRFSNLIAKTIIEECNACNYPQGCQKINDLMQDVYVRLLKNDCRAFTNFHSPHENAIIKFLKITTIRIVLDNYREYTRGEVVYSRRYQDSEQMHSSPETGDSSSQQQTRTELEEEINECLQAILKNKKHATRDAWIYRLHVFRDLQAKEIAALPGLAIEQKTVHNILTFLNGEVKSCLQKKGIGP